MLAPDNCLLVSSSKLRLVATLQLWWRRLFRCLSVDLIKTIERDVNRRLFLKNVAISVASPSVKMPRAMLAEEVQPVVRTRAGLVRGKVRDGVAIFLGVPYGADTRTRRFRPPLPVAPWAGIRDVVTWGDRSPQLSGRAAMTSRKRNQTPVSIDMYHLPPEEGVSSEDCLRLNIWTPSSHSRGHQHRPVLFYIHGGAYNSGTANCILYDGTRLCHRGDVVVITVNHRLNAFGFLYLAGLTNDPAYTDSGNVGMLDLVLALKWVQDNIAEFGGDPSRVTIFGQSGGGAKCATIMAMPSAHGLFHRVMTMSGQQVTAAPKAIAAARTKDFLAHLNLQNTLSDKLRMKLNAISLDRLEEAAHVSSAWLPVVDGHSLPRDPFSPGAPPLSEDVPMILGNTHDETRGLIGGDHPELFTLTWDEVAPALTKYVGSYLGPVTADSIIADYRRWYSAYTPSDIFFAAATAFRSWPGQVIEAEQRANSPAQQRTWVYEMDWESPVSGGRFGAPHTVDIPFFFDNLASAPGMVGRSVREISSAQPLASAMSETLISFARTGIPNHRGLPDWPPYNLNNRPTMIWNRVPHIVDDPRGNERRLAVKAHYRQPGT